MLPYFFDCIHLESIQNEKLLTHINDHGKVLYEKETKIEENETGGELEMRLADLGGESP